MLESSPHAFVCNTNMYTCTKHLLGERKRFKWMGERIKIKVSNICFGACILDMKLRIKMANFLYKFNDVKQCMQKKWPVAVMIKKFGQNCQLQFLLWNMDNFSFFLLILARICKINLLLTNASISWNGKINQCKKEINFIMKMVMVVVIVLKCKANGSWRQSKKLKKWAKKNIEREENFIK